MSRAAVCDPPEGLLKDDDYMSASFLAEVPEGGSNSSSSGHRGRKRPLEPSQPEPPKGLKQMMEERRNEGLETSIGSDNVGFKMLAKMGFRSGSGLGRQEQGRAAPLSVNTTAGKAGLGRVEEVQRRKDAKVQRKVQVEKETTETWEQHLRRSYGARQVRRVLRRAAGCLQNLDEREGIERHDLWLPGPEEEQSGLQQVFEDGDGGTYSRPLTAAQDAQASLEVPGEQGRDLEDMEEPELVERLERCLRYLRSEHDFLLVYGCKCSDVEEDFTTQQEFEMLMEEGE